MIINKVLLRRIKKPKTYELPKYETATEKEKKPLFLILQRTYFNAIIDGTKNKEYRDDTPFYYSRFMNKDCSKFRNYDSVIFQEGYHKNARRMTVKIKKITLGSRFVIHLDEIIDKNF